MCLIVPAAPAEEGKEKAGVHNDIKEKGEEKASGEPA